MHITNGSSAAGSLRSALDIAKEDFFIVHDVLSCGPLKSFVGMKDWREIRINYWDHIQTLCGRTPLSHNALERDLYRYYEELTHAKVIHIWLGTSLSDQTMLCFLAFLLGHLKIDFERVNVHQLSKRVDNGHEIQSIGQLSPEKIVENDTYFKLSKKSAAPLIECWDVLTAPNPGRYLQFIKADQKGFPFLVRALKQLINRYPDHQTGLTIWEEAILRNTDDHGPEVSRVIGYTLANGFDNGDLTGDLYLFATLKKLANPKLSRRLLKLNRLDGDMRNTTAELTLEGKHVLEGVLNAIELNGIDDWVYGVHVSSEMEKYWYRCDGSLVEVPSRIR